MALTDAPQEQPKPPGSGLRSLLPFTTVALILAALYVAWTFYSRSESNKQAAAALAEKQQASEKHVADQIFGSGEVSFSTFSVDNVHLHHGQSTQLCYGVVNATTVTIDPPVEQLKPTYRHCFDISPKTTTTYTITAADAKGGKKTDSVTVHVE